MRVLLISHTCISRTAGQPKAYELSQMPDVELRVLVPDRWYEYGEWKQAQTAYSPHLDLRIGKVLWPWAGPGQWYAHWYPRLLPLLRDFRPDIIDLWEEPYGLVSAHATWLRNTFFPQTRIVAETEQNINKHLPPPFGQFRNYTLRHADFAIGRNVEALDVLRGNGFRGTARVVPNAVDAELFRPLNKTEARQSILRELSLKENPLFLIGYVGRLVEEKGLTDLVDALRFLPSNVHVLFVGSGPLDTELQRLARELKVEAQVHFLPSRPLEELPIVMNALDVFVLPSRTTPSWKEQFGRVIIEAQSCATPVIGTDSGAIPEVVGNGGLVIPERNSQALAQAISTLQQNPAQRAAMGAAGRRQVEQLYTWKQVAQRMRDIYREVLELPPL
jgi:glycosyltransferase involved in cell wall biosynthesis